MPSASFTKIPDFIEYLAEGAIDMENDSFVIALSNTAPAAETPNPTTSGNGVLANVTQIAYTNLSSRALTVASSAESGGTYTSDFDNLVLTASGGAVADFRYVYIYDDTAASDPLVALFDYGSTVSLADGESLNVNFSASGLFTIA